jgi:hypothetical protein
MMLDLTRQIADTLEGCEKGARCKLASCPQCSTAHQRHIVQQLRHLWAPGTPLTKVTMVPVELQRAPGGLHTIKLPSSKRHIRRVFERAKVDHHPSIGFIDLSYNNHVDDLWDDHWQPHLELITTAEIWRAIKGPLRAQLITSSSVKIPLLGVPVKDFHRQVSYAFKPTPVRKTYFAAVSPQARPHKQHLKGRQEEEFLLWFGLQPAASRAFMLNVRAYGSRLLMLAGKGCHQGKEK